MYVLGETEGYSTNGGVPGVKELLEQTFGLLNIRDISTLTGIVSRQSIVAMLGTLLERVQAYVWLVARMLLATCGLRSKRNPSNLHSIVTRVSYLGDVVKTKISTNAMCSGCLHSRRNQMGSKKWFSRAALPYRWNSACVQE